MQIFHQVDFNKEEIFKVFHSDVQAISKFIKENKKKIEILNGLQVSSKKIQDFLKDEMIKLGYKYESAQNLFRPDYIKKLFGGVIIIEVERGKTINNNMDFADFWKCHISGNKSCLILIVPEKVPRTKTSLPIYNSVLRRMKPLYDKENYSNVRALAVIDY